LYRIDNGGNKLFVFVFFICTKGKLTDFFHSTKALELRGRANTSTITPLGGIGGKGKTPVRQGIGAATGGFEVEVQNYNIIVKNRNVSATISMPPIGKDDPMGCLSCPAPHSIAESLRDGHPVVIILSDQSFPPVLPPTVDGNCTVIIWVEDSELWELEKVLYDRLKSFCKPHGTLPSGSVILVGSMSHLAKTV
jgi:hypothetical protein